MPGRRSSPRVVLGIGLGLTALVGCSSTSHGGNSGDPAAAPGGAVAASDAALTVASVAPHHLGPKTPIVVRFTTPTTANSPLPQLAPAVPGQWARQDDSAVFTPSQSYPPEATLHVRYGAAPLHALTTPKGSLLAAQQILSRLDYLPLRSTATEPVSDAERADEVYSPPHGKFVWRWSGAPDALKKNWSPGGKYNAVMRGAVIAFQHEANLTMDGFVGPKTWQALLAADRAGHHDPDTYSFISADLNLPQRLSVWRAGQTVLTSAVNGGVSGAPTPLGTYPVYERFKATTMQGTNPDGSHYKDPGVPWVNYFSGGSAVHGFPRASYGSPQSVGCLELPISTAKQVYSLISYGTLVDVSGPYVAPAPAASPSAPPSPKPTHSASPTPSHSAAPKPSDSHSPKPSPSPSKRHH